MKVFEQLILACGVFAFLVAIPGSSRSQDTVWLENSEHTIPSRHTGTILDYTGIELRLKTLAGREKRFRTSRVLDVESNWQTDHETANAAMERGEFQEALVAYQQAHRRERRVWARRSILARMVQCFVALEQFAAAGDTFLAILESDPATIHIETIPLAWTPSEWVSRKKAEAWLSQSSVPAAVLLGASHLMSTNQRPAAIRALAELSTSDDPHLAALADAQKWRSQAMAANEQQSRSWARRVETMPLAIRGGPYLVLSRTYLRQQRWEEAALAALRVPTEYASQRQLAAAALLVAAEALQALNRHDEAARLRQEVIDRYGDTRWKTRAQQQLPSG